MKNFAKEIATGTGAYAACVEVGQGSVSSIFMNF
jgi:hypothetical protein